MEKTISYQGNLIVNKKENFKNGKMEKVYLNEDLEIEFEEGHLEGSYTSPIILTDNFNTLVASWNVNTPGKTNIEVFIQVKVEDKWTMWYSYGQWSQNNDSGSVRNQSDKFGELSIDTLEIFCGKYANALRYKVQLKREDEIVESPSIKAIYITMNTSSKNINEPSKDINYLVELDLPERTQMTVAEIGDRICSPTSVSMVLEYYGKDISTEEVASGVFDNEADIYGNWSYNASFAGMEGLNSYVARFNNVDEIKKKITEGIPVIASIKTKSKDALFGAPQAYPNGHLIVVRGFKEKDGEEYVIVNDPASPQIKNVRREYKLSEFETAWSNIVYIISKDSKYKYGILNKAVVPINLNPNFESQMADEGLYGMIVKILEEKENGWYLIESSYDYSGYVHSSNIILDDERAKSWKKRAYTTIHHNIVDVMTNPSYKGYVVGLLTKGATVISTGKEEDNWIEIELADGEISWIRKDFAKPKVEVGGYVDKTELRKRLVDTALSYLGTQYRWGGKSPLGIDCSGLCSISYLLNGIKIYRDAVLKDKYMKEISIKEIKLGDLIFFPGHVAMYIGDDRYVHSSSGINGVNINSLNPVHGDYKEDLAKTITGVGTIF